MEELLRLEILTFISHVGSLWDFFIIYTESLFLLINVGYVSLILFCKRQKPSKHRRLFIISFSLFPLSLSFVVSYAFVFGEQTNPWLSIASCYRLFTPGLWESRIILFNGKSILYQWAIILPWRHSSFQVSLGGKRQRRNMAKDRKVIPDPIDDRKFQE